MPDVYHEGELAVQERAGVREMAGRIGRGIRDTIPDPAREFLLGQDFAVLGGLDPGGRVWASPLTGGEGFLDAVSERLLRVSPRAVVGDPLAGGLVEGAPVGLLAIDFATRRRMRLNGRVSATGDGGFEVSSEQVYSNCPKYIQLRETVPGRPHEPGAPRTLDELGEDEVRMVSAADTFFIASYHEGAGADCSHRGGALGFVKVEDACTLVWPDYAGNTMFQTLGNIAVDGRAGLLFVDFSNGNALALTGRARILWDEERAAGVRGAERLVELRIEQGVALPGAVPLRWRLREYSPFNP
jgi:uncharacterized protein